MSRTISRRQFLKALAIVAGCTELGQLAACSPAQEASRRSPTATSSPAAPKLSPSTMPSSTARPSPTAGATESPAPSPTSSSTLAATDTGAPTSASTPTSTETAAPTSQPEPTGTTSPRPTTPRVVHVHDATATSWSGQTDYWNCVDQGVVHEMVDQGLMALTGASAVANAWRELLPNYRPGQAIAIKVNLNNTFQCDDTDGQIDALAHPVNSIVRGLKLIGVAETDIWIYDAVRAIPYRLVAGSQYDNLRYYGRLPCRRDRASFDSNDAHAWITLSPPSDLPLPPPIKITDVLIQATYLINMPIMKTHGGTGITLSFKNHLGTVDEPAAFHSYAGLHEPSYRSDYSALVELYQNPHIVGKTVLTIGDGLFAAKDNNTAPPSRWQTFGNQVPNSLFFSTDPVAIDCVMYDFLASETAIPAAAGDYLRLASDAGLGVFERGNPWGSGYTRIDYVRMEL